MAELRSADLTVAIMQAQIDAFKIGYEVGSAGKRPLTDEEIVEMLNDPTAMGWREKT